MIGWLGLSLVSILSVVWVNDLQSWQTITCGESETRDLGRRLGELACAGLVILLNGDLGAGKTCFSQGIALGLNVPSSSPVTSPSYTLLNIHYGRLPIYHFDLYRLSQVEDLADLGYDDFAEGDGLTLVEWADRMTGGLTASLEIIIEHLSAERRNFSFHARDDSGRNLLAQLAGNGPPENKAT